MFKIYAIRDRWPNTLSFFIIDILIYTLPILPYNICNRILILFVYYILYKYKINIYYTSIKEVYTSQKKMKD
jgi:hypothetical protein